MTALAPKGDTVFNLLDSKCGCSPPPSEALSLTCKAIATNMSTCRTEAVSAPEAHKTSRNARDPRELSPSRPFVTLHSVFPIFYGLS